MPKIAGFKRWREVEFDSRVKVWKHEQTGYTISVSSEGEVLYSVVMYNPTNYSYPRSHDLIGILFYEVETKEEASKLAVSTLRAFPKNFTSQHAGDPLEIVRYGEYEKALINEKTGEEILNTAEIRRKV